MGILTSTKRTQPTGGPRSAYDDDFAGPATLARRMRLLLPTDQRKVYWDWLVVVIVLWNVFMIPFSFGFGLVWQAGAGLEAVDWIVDILFLVDMVINFRTAYYEDDGSIVLEYARIRQRYLRTYFFFDLAATIPFDRFIELGGVSASEATLVGLAKLPRLLRLSRLMKKFDEFAAAKALRIIVAVIGIILAAHWVACIWFMIGSRRLPPLVCEGECREGDLPGSSYSWVDRMQIRDTGLDVQYFASLYWALTMVIKSPWLAPAPVEEFIFGSVIVLIGAVIFAYFLGNVTAIITSGAAAAAAYRDSMSALNNFSRAYNFKADLRKSLLRYFDGYFSERKGFDKADMLAKVPRHMRPTVLIELYKPLLSNCAFLSDLSLGGCAAFLEVISVEVCETGDSLFSAGSLLETMYILKHGELQVMHPPKPEMLKVKGLLGPEARVEEGRKSSVRVPQGRVEKPGTLVGFQNVFEPPHPVTFSVRACTRSTFYSIQREELLTVRPSPARRRPPSREGGAATPSPALLDSEHAPTVTCRCC